MNRTIAPAHPKLRPIEIRPHAHNGQTYFVLRDPLELHDGSLLLPQPFAAALSFFDGKRTVEEIAAAFALRFGFPLEPAVVDQLVEAVDEACLLENERSAAARRQKTEAYRQEPFRPARLAGLGYPQDPPGTASWSRTLPHFRPSRLLRIRRPRSRRAGSVCSARISTTRGRRSAHGILAAGRGRDPRCGPGSSCWVQFTTEMKPATLARQNYATPYGLLPTAQGAVDAVVDVIGEEAAFAGELRHINEHSLELVAVWLHHMRRGEPVEMVPILVGSLYRHIWNGSSPEEDRRINDVLAALTAAGRGRRVAVVASGDMSHVGAAFGGDPLDDAARARVRQDDEDLIAAMRRGSASDFYDLIRGVRDRNNVCGVTPIYLMLRLLGDDVRGELHGYASCPADAEDASAVTVCGMVFR